MSSPNPSTSVLAQLLQAVPDARPQMFFKTSLTALSHAMEDQILASDAAPLAIASFQRERFYRQEAHRYQRIANKSDQVYVLAAPETEFRNQSGAYETVAFAADDALAREWHLVVVGRDYANCLICRERTASYNHSDEPAMDSNRRFEGIWTFDRAVSLQAAALLLDRIATYRPELTDKLAAARERYLQPLAPSAPPPAAPAGLENTPLSNPDPFVSRLVNYLQVSQYKLLKAYRSIAAQEQRERLIYLMTVAIRRSLDPQEVLEIACRELGQVLGACRCIIYRCREDDAQATINHEFRNTDVRSLAGETWLLAANPLFQAIAANREPIGIEDVTNEPRLQAASRPMQRLLQDAALVSWLLVPVCYKGQLLGMVELHHCGPTQERWTKEEIGLVEAIATQVGTALIQAEAYASMEDLTQQLEALDRTRSNLVAITGHELRTPLSTIQVCLESLASEPDMAAELRQVMLSTALTDAERLRKLVQDFLTLSKLESGRVEWNPEPLSLRECLDLGLSHLHARQRQAELPEIRIALAEDLPLVRADGEWLVEVLAKLLDNACKFTNPQGTVTIDAHCHEQSVAVVVADTGRGIEPNRLETVFDLFYQEEGALQRTTGGTGLGLAICRQIVRRWGGQIWAESEGKDCGSRFHFTVPLATGAESNPPAIAAPTRSATQRKSSSKRSRKNPKR